MTIVTLRPNGDSYKQVVSYSTGTTIWSLIDDTPDDDATYVFAASNEARAYAILNMPNTISVSATQRVKAARVRARVRIDAFDGGSVGYLGVDLRNAADGIGAGTLNEKFGRESTTPVTGAGVWRTRPPYTTGSIEWTKSIIDDTQVVLRWYYSYGSHINLRLTELFIDFDIRDAPTLSGVTATGYDTSTKPTISWTYTPNTDNDPQKAYKLKIFSSEQYNDPDFTPNDIAVWDSGTVNSNSTSAVVGKALQPGATYRAYMQVASDFNSFYWFTGWVNSSNFSITSVPMVTPTMTVTADNTVPWNRNIINVIGTFNMIYEQDASFEDTTVAPVGSWISLTNCSLARSTAQSAYGLASMTMTASSAATMEAITRSGTSGMLVEGGTTYTFLASFRTAVTGRSVNVGARFYDRTGTIIGSSNYGSAVTDTTSGWTQATMSMMAPANAVYAAMLLRVNSPGNAEVHYVDKVSMSPSSSTTWTPGGYYDNGYVYIERAVVTTSKRNLIPPNVATGGDFSQSASGFSTSGTYSRVRYDTNHQHRGRGSILWNVRDTTAKMYFGFGSAVAANTENVNSIWAIPGKTYTFGVYAKGAATFSSQLNLQALDKDGNTVGSPTNGGGVSITTSWQMFTATITVPAGASQVRAHLDNTASVVDKKVWADSCQWVIGSTADTEPYPPGGQPAAWEPVRGASYTPDFYGGVFKNFGTPGDQIRTIMDNEVPPGQTVLYRARSIGDATFAQPSTSSVTTNVIPTMLDAPGAGFWILRDPLNPENSLRVHSVSLSESKKEEVGNFSPLYTVSNKLQDVSNRPIIVTDFIGGEDGDMEVWCDSENEWHILRKLLNARNPLFLIFPDIGGTFVRITDRSWARESKRTGVPPDSIWRRKTRLGYIEVDRPA